MLIEMFLIPHLIRASIPFSRDVERNSAIGLPPLSPCLKATALATYLLKKCKGLTFTESSGL